VLILVGGGRGKGDEGFVGGGKSRHGRRREESPVKGGAAAVFGEREKEWIREREKDWFPKKETLEIK
jgi:hypothetical protein